MERKVARRALFGGVLTAGALGAVASAADEIPSGSGAPAVVERVLEAPLSLRDPRVGCLLDGRDDESAKVADAISMLPRSGGHIYHPPGVLRTKSILLDRPVRWEGAGDQASAIRAVDGFDGTLMTVGAAFTSVSDVRLDGAGTASTLLKSTSVRIRFGHLHLQGAAGTGLLFTGRDWTAAAHAAQVCNLRVQRCSKFGVSVESFSYDQEFVNLWIGECGTGLRVANNDCFFSNLHVWGSKGDGVMVSGKSNRFANVYIESNGQIGMNFVPGSAGTRVVGGSIRTNAAHGIAFSERTAAIGLSVSSNGGYGFYGRSCSDCIVQSCEFLNGDGESRQRRSIVTDGSSNGWVVTGNVLRAADHADGGHLVVGDRSVLVGNVD